VVAQLSQAAPEPGLGLAKPDLEVAEPELGLAQLL
jgi:hypothetical protein